TTSLYTKVSSVTAHAGVDVYLNEFDAISVGASTAGGTFSLTAGGAITFTGQVIAPTISSANTSGDVAFQSSLGNNTTTSLTINAAGSITQSSNSILLTGSTMSLSAGASIGSTSQSVRIAATELTAHAGGSLYIDQTGVLTLHASDAAGTFKLVS